MKTYSDIFDHIDASQIDEPSEMDSEAPVSMIFALEDSSPMEKTASSILDRIASMSFADADIWKIEGSNVVRVTSDVIEE